MKKRQISERSNNNLKLYLKINEYNKKIKKKIIFVYVQ